MLERVIPTLPVTFIPTAGVLRAARKADLALARWWFSRVREKPGLIVLAFHATVRDERELHSGLIEPQYAVTIQEVDSCIAHLKGSGYTPVSPRDIEEGLTQGGRFFMLSFDDGYFNNTQVLPLLETTGVPALFGIVTDNVVNGEGFWWDTLFRERSKQGRSAAPVRAEIKKLYTKHPLQIREWLSQEFGRESIRPRSDLDRPLSPSELRQMAACKYVFFGNHTAGHEWLPGCTRSELESTVNRAQDALEFMTHTRPRSIVYPFGGCSPAAVDVAKKAGLAIGFTTRFAKVYLPLPRESPAMTSLPRITLSRSRDPVEMCEKARYDGMLSQKLFALVGSRTNPHETTSRQLG